MKVREYISSKFRSFDIELSEADLLDLSISGGVKLEDEVNEVIISKIELGFAKSSFIPSLQNRAVSVGEGSVSMSYNIKGAEKFYSFLCNKYGLEDYLNPKPKATFY